TKIGPSGSPIPGPALMPCGLPPSWSQETLQTICMIVETPAMDSAAVEKYFLHGGSAPSVLNRFFVAKNSSVHGTRNKTPVAMYIPLDCSNSNSLPPQAEFYAQSLVA